jgi:hypothetical protein
MRLLMAEKRDVLFLDKTVLFKLRIQYLLSHYIFMYFAVSLSFQF